MFLKILEMLNQSVWMVVIPVSLACGGYFTLRSRAFQIRHFGEVLKSTILRPGAAGEASAKETMSPFRAACTALAGTLGTGNIIGVATAIAVGGPGAVFWMWVTALLGMMLSFAENYLGSVSRERSGRGWRGGAMLYMQKYLRWKRAPGLYAVMTVLFGLMMGGMLQSATVAGALHNGLSVPPAVSGFAAAAAAVGLAAGGVSKIGGTVERLVPLMAVVYTVGALILIVLNMDMLPRVFCEIFGGAFGFRSGLGGAAGAGMAAALRYGMARGIFSNEAGLGSAALAHAASSLRSGREQGLWGIFEVFVDTICMCTLTALLILTSGAAGAGPQAVAYAFSIRFGQAGVFFVSAVLMMFGFSTILNWSYLGLQAWDFLARGRGRAVFFVVFFLAVAGGALIKIEAAWEIADLLMAAMLLMNLPALFLLRKRVLRVLP